MRAAARRAARRRNRSSHATYRTSRSCAPRASEAEWQARVQLAAAYRIFDHLGWTELIYNHISLRVPARTDIS